MVYGEPNLRERKEKEKEKKKEKKQRVFSVAVSSCGGVIYL